MIYEDREDAGRRLAEHLRARFGAAESQSVVLGVPRGGVVVAEPVAEALRAQLDVSVPRKLGAPGNPELAVGALAVAGGQDITLFDEESIAFLAVPRAYLYAEVERQRKEIERRLAIYREGRDPVTLADRKVFLVDDGIATGLTMRAAAAAVARSLPSQLVIAVPVAPPETVRDFASHGLTIEALATPSPFRAVGRFYRDFRAVSDEEVIEILRRRAHS